MRRLPTTGNTPARAARLAFASYCAGLSLLAALGGCNPATRAAKGDPLVGEMHPEPKFTPTPPAGRTSRSARSGVPAIPTNTSAGSAAAIAQSRPEPLDDPLTGARPLGIPGGPGTQTVGNWQGALTSGQGGNVNPGLRPPQTGVQPLPPAPGPGGPQTGLAPAGSWQSPYAGFSYEQLQDRLRDLRVTVQHQETIAGGWKFTCSVPNPFNPDFSRTYEATARDYRSALIAVLDKIDSDRPTR